MADKPILTVPAALLGTHYGYSVQLFDTYEERETAKEEFLKENKDDFEASVEFIEVVLPPMLTYQVLTAFPNITVNGWYETENGPELFEESGPTLAVIAKKLIEKDEDIPHVDFEATDQDGDDVTMKLFSSMHKLLRLKALIDGQ